MAHPPENVAEPAPEQEAADPQRSTFGALVQDARQQLEARVLAQIQQSLGSAFPFGTDDQPGAPAPGSAPGRGRSMTREIGRLDRLRRSGALTDEQYQRAVDRLLAEDEPT